jgi:hypothetical protein
MTYICDKVKIFPVTKHHVISVLLILTVDGIDW